MNQQRKKKILAPNNKREVCHTTRSVTSYIMNDITNNAWRKPIASDKALLKNIAIQIKIALLINM